MNSNDPILRNPDIESETIETVESLIPDHETPDQCDNAEFTLSSPALAKKMEQCEREAVEEIDLQKKLALAKSQADAKFD